ncbi:hypothetical protein ABIB40_002029 [Pedobacter sp. UYP30]|uniref:hypothetical protein n=1 Tax=Pedobacter sp. UYP30 TaxID=1756400 RepID=UPI003395FDDB
MPKQPLNNPAPPLLPMRLKYLVVFLFLTNVATAQKSFHFPKIPSAISAVEQAVPAGWHLFSKTYGDLNNDGTDDLTVILEANQEINETRVYGDNHTAIIREKQKPRILAMFFRDKNSNQYQLSVQNNNFILRAKEGGVVGEPFEQMAIKDEQLYLRFKGGSVWRWEMGYTFKFLNNSWTLTNAISSYYNNNTGAFTERIFDFINRQLFTNLGNLYQRDLANRKTSEILLFGKMRTFDTFKKPWAWEIMPDVYL